MATLLRKIDNETTRLLPAYFAMVMATGIVSIAVSIYGFHTFAQSLFYLNIVIYIGLWIMTAIRLLRHMKNYISDLGDHVRGPGFFTVIVGTNTLGSQFFVLQHAYTTAFAFWVFGVVLWFFYQYSIFSLLMISKHKPSLEKGINGTWLIAIVSTESVAVLGAQLSGVYPNMLLISIIMYFIGWMTYIVIISMIDYRLLFFDLEPEGMTGPYWINMGATAITTLAGALILMSIHGVHPYPVDSAFKQIGIFIQGATLLIWSYGSWWVPWLFIMGFWRHYNGKVKLIKYDPAFWGAVFPMGMYTVCTFMLVKATGLTELSFIPTYFVYIAIAGWLYQFSGFAFVFVRGVISSSSAVPA